MQGAKLDKKENPLHAERPPLSLAATTSQAVSSSNRGHNADGIAILRRSIFFRQIANILVVYIHVHEAAQLAIVGEEMLAQIAEFRGQPSQRLADRGRLDLRGIALSCVSAKRRRNNHLHSHRVSPNVSAGFWTHPTLTLPPPPPYVIPSKPTPRQSASLPATTTSLPPPLAT